MLNPRLQHFLEDHRAQFQTIAHPRAYTAQETAAAAHVSGHDFAKTVVVDVDGRLALVVLPASRRLNLGSLRKSLRARAAALADEAAFRDRFPDCELGAMPPFGELYDLDVYLDADLATHPSIAFNAGTHTDVVRMPYAEFERIAQPRLLRLDAAS